VSRHTFLTGLAAALLVAATSATPAHADTIGVATDNGTVGSFQLTNLGGGNFELQLFPNPGPPIADSTLLTLVNGSAVVTPATFSTPVYFSVSGLPGPNVALTQAAVATKVFDSNVASPTNAQAKLEYKLNSADIGSGTGGVNGLLLHGLITSVLSPLVDVTVVTSFGPPLVTTTNTYDFTHITSINFALTGTTYFNPSGVELAPGAGSMAYVFATEGARVMGSGGFSQAVAVPEPASLAIVSVSLVGLLACRRFGKRTPTA